MLERLDWDDDEAATHRTVSPWPGQGVSEPPDTILEPPDWLDALSVRRVDKPLPQTQRDGHDAGASTLRAPAARAQTLLSESCADETSRSPASDFDACDTAKREALAEGAVERGELPPHISSSALPLLRPMQRTTLHAATGESEPAAWGEAQGGSVAPVALSMGPSALSATDELQREVQQLRRRVRWTAAMSAMTMVCCALLAVHAVTRSGHRPTAARLTPGLTTAAWPLLARAAQPPRSEQQQHLHEQRAPAAPATATQPSPSPANTVEVVLRVVTPGTTVCIARRGGAPQILRGPFPKTLALEPGSYALFAAKPGKSRSIPLHLSRNQTRREVTIRLR